MTASVLPLDDPAAGPDVAGGKGASLARLSAAGLPVPTGFHITTAAYRRFVAEHSLQKRILAALAAGPVEASREISGFFSAYEIPAELAGPITDAYAALSADGEASVAVRSSATAEDLPDASFAGQQDTYLEIHGGAAVLDAVRRCWASLWTSRAIAYRDEHGIPHDDVAIAVVVQEMVHADSAGVLFTADPVTGGRDHLTINAVEGLGEALVSGQANPQSIVVSRTPLEISSRQGESVLTDEPALELARLGIRIEELYGGPMDIEWAIADDVVSIVQARPITVEAQEDWNDSLAADYLWTCANLGEAIPSVMTPATWSLVQIFMSECMSVSTLGPAQMSGNIGGRFYLNLSLTMAAGKALGMEDFIRRTSEQAFGRIPSDVEIPALPMSRWQVLKQLVPTATRFLKKIAEYQKRFPAMVADAPSRCDRVRTAIDAASTPQELASLWSREVEPLLRDVSRMLGAGARIDAAGLVRIRPWLLKLVDEQDANALLTGMHTGGDPLASLGPVVGLAQLARGEISRPEYARTWGHRCPDEFEISVPRPGEDPAWIDRELAGVRDQTQDVSALLSRQEAAREAALERFRERHPHKVKAFERRIAGAAKGARGREAARSEVIRGFWVMRDFWLRAGELTGRGDDVFFLPVQELLDVLGGSTEPWEHVGARRKTYESYRALPPYPTLIRGHFDPFRWAADPHRRSDVYDETRDIAPLGDAVTGFAGAAGVVEGVARVLESVAQGEQLHAGEVLVTTVTNVGWTPLFPRAAAVVTDIGAPLSHAAIVARELGIPAVVGTGNATQRIRSGDRVRVDGGNGTVEIL